MCLPSNEITIIKEKNESRAPRHKKNAALQLKYKHWSLTENVGRDSCQNKDKN